MWDQTTSLREKRQGKNGFLLRVRAGDWIVHIDLPAYGRCVAVKAVGEYGFDEGIQCPWGNDLNNFIPVYPDSMIVFHRIKPSIIPTLNMAPWRRANRILEVDDFLESIENLK